MSRLLVMSALILSFFAEPGAAQQARTSLSDEEITAMIKKARRMAAVDQYGCIKYPVDDTIVVCGPDRERERQRLPESPRVYQKGDRLVGGGLRTTYLEKDPPPAIGTFGFVPPPALDYAEVMKGLPEPDMVVPEGETQTAVP